jgi:hypothetical protein
MQVVPQIKVRVVAYKGRIVIVPKDPAKDITNKGPRMWWPTGGPNGNILGCVLGNSQTMLGLSKEAIELMERVRRNHDAVGDLGWWKCNDGTYAFSWWGSIHRIVNPDTSEGDRDFRIHEGQYIKIVNQVPAAAKKVIDSFNLETEKEACSWNEPSSIEYEDTETEDED